MIRKIAKNPLKNVVGSQESLRILQESQRDGKFPFRKFKKCLRIKKIPKNPLKILKNPQKLLVNC